MRLARWIKSYRRSDGFTILELMTVVAVLGVLTTVAAPELIRYMRKSKTIEVSEGLSKIVAGAVIYYNSHEGQLPCSLFLPGGACSITVDDRLVCSCLMLGVEANGKKINTIEGMADGEKLHPLQQKFLEHAALQCGICTPGFLVAAKSLLERNPDPTETEVRYWLAGNLCRCTGYDKIVRAVMDAAAEMRGAA